MEIIFGLYLLVGSAYFIAIIFLRYGLGLYKPIPITEILLSVIFWPIACVLGLIYIIEDLFL